MMSAPLLAHFRAAVGAPPRGYRAFSAMLPITIRFPTAEEEERNRQFTVHRNYPASIELFLSALYGYGGAPLAAVDTRGDLCATVRCRA